MSGQNFGFELGETWESFGSLKYGNIEEQALRWQRLSEYSKFGR